MRDRKYRFVLYSLYDPDGIRCRLEAMARKGWLLDGIFLSVWRYRRIEPRALPFTVVYDPEIGPYDPDPTLSTFPPRMIPWLPCVPTAAGPWRRPPARCRFTIAASPTPSP